MERKVVDLYRSRGWSAHRTAGSHGGYDVVALGPRDIHLIQLKSQEHSRLTGYDADIAKLEAVVAPRSARRIFAVWRHGYGWLMVKEVGTTRKSKLPTWLPRPSEPAPTSAS